MRKATVVSAAVLLMLVACAGDQGSASQWTELRPMDVARSEHPAVILGEEIIVIGGLVESGLGGTAVTARVEAYDPDRGSWRSLPGLPAARHQLMAPVVGSRLFVIGGLSGPGFVAVATVRAPTDRARASSAPNLMNVLQRTQGDGVLPDA